jgi:4-hydroxy-tetrahydrodipicolinate synthase
MFTGCGTAMVTPFRGNGSLDEETLRKLIRRQIEQGIDFLVPCGTTGESPTLTREEHLRTVAITIEESAQARVRCAANSNKESAHLARKVPVLAGAGGNNTHEVIELARECEKLGADGILSVTPYYNKATQEGLYQHYKAIAASIKIPIILYSVQGRTGINIEPSTVVRLSEIENIIGIKEASGNITQIAEVLHRVPEKFIVLSGDDAMTLPVIALGGRGVVSVISNQIPGAMAELARLANHGDFAAARQLQRRWLPLMLVNFVEANPIPVKWAMSLMGLLEPVYRLPMVEPSAISKQKIEQVLESVGLMAAAGAH